MDFWDAMAPYADKVIVGIGGTKFSGKSYAIRGLLAMLLMDKPLHACLYGREYDDLKDLHIEPLKAELSDFIKTGKVKWNENNKSFYFKESGAILKVQQIASPKDIKAENGKGFDIVVVDEAQKFTDFELRFFRSLVRPSGLATSARTKLRRIMAATKSKAEYELAKRRLDEIYYIPKLLMSFNWGEIGHNYLMRVFWNGCDHPRNPGLNKEEFEMVEQIDERTGMKVKVYVEKPSEYKFIFAHWKDNPRGLKDNPQYINSIRQLPEPWRTAYLKGDPHAFVGLKFKILDPIHEIDMDEVLKPYGGFVPDHWQIIGAYDPGTDAPAAFSLYARTPEGINYQISDYYFSGRAHETHMHEIYQHILDNRWLKDERMPRYIIAGKDATHRKSKREIYGHNVTLQQIFWKEYGLKLVEANTSRTQGAMALANYLDYTMDKWGNLVRKPKLYFAYYIGPDGRKVHLCKPTMDELKALKSDEKNVEDIQQGPSIPDHAYDKIRYYVMGARDPAPYEAAAAKLEQISDYGRIPKEKVYGYEDKNVTSLDACMGSEPIEM